MNLQEKLSGLKGLVSHSHSKRRHKGDLTVDMISPPLGDFRHTMHVGRGGDVFGDTSFLSNHGGTDFSPPPPAISPIIKNAISLPRLDVDMPNGSPTTKVLFPSSQNTPEEKKSSYDCPRSAFTLITHLDPDRAGSELSGRLFECLNDPC
uniref:CRIB domain-containing protein n=1 Tax=Astatotilapia calliptera TaxID=8154 RepID=A0AAX7UU69_ASTCA